MTAAVGIRASVSLILRSLALGMAGWIGSGVVGWLGSAVVGWLVVAVAACIAMALAPSGRRIVAGVWAVIGGWAALMLLAMPFITPVGLG